MLKTNDRSGLTMGMELLMRSVKRSMESEFTPAPSFCAAFLWCHIYYWGVCMVGVVIQSNCLGILCRVLISYIISLRVGCSLL